jgi:cytochrome b pre-mRNA-processing protein 3
MIFPLFRRGPRGRDTISTLYGMIVAQARLPVFYRDYAIADTVNGRFDLLVLHMAMVLDRLMADTALKWLGQGIFDRFCQDMDHNLREMGVSDLKVPKQMRQIGEAFYGSSRAYRAAWAETDDAALVQAVQRNIYDGSQASAAPRLAAYVRQGLRDLGAQSAQRLAAGELHFPEPTGIPETVV